MLFGKKQQFAICILAGMLMTDFIFFGYIPLRTRLKDIENKRNVQQLTSAKAATERSQLPVLEGRLAQLQVAVGNYEATVPLQRDIGAFVQKIAGLMSEHNLKDQIIQPGDEVRVEGLNCIQVSMQCKGSLRQIFGFFKQLQSMERLVRVQEVKLVTGGDFSGQINVEAKATIYYQSQAEQG